MTAKAKLTVIMITQKNMFVNMLRCQIKLPRATKGLLSAVFLLLLQQFLKLRVGTHQLLRADLIKDYLVKHVCAHRSCREYLS